MNGLINTLLDIYIIACRNIGVRLFEAVKVNLERISCLRCDIYMRVGSYMYPGIGK